MKKALKIIFVSIISLCVLVIAAGYIALTQIDFNSYKDSIVKAVYNATGRKLAIGDIQIKPSLTPMIELRDVSFSNAEWSKNPEMVKAGAIDLEFAIIPLLEKNFVIDTFGIREAVVYLEESANHGANWEFSAEAAPAVEEKAAFSLDFSLIKSAEAAEVNTEDNVLTMLSSLVVKKIAFENVVINYTDKASKTQSYNVKSLNLDENNDGNIDFSFDVNNGLYRGTGDLGAPNLLESKEGYPVKADLNVMGIDVSTDMVLKDVLGDISFSGTVQAKNFIGKNYGYNESADVVLKGDLKNIEATIKSLKIAGNEVTGTVSAKLETKIPEIKAVLSSQKIDISSFSAKTKTAWTFSLVKEAQATTLVPAEIIPYQALSGIAANADLSIARVVNGSMTLVEDLGLNAAVSNNAAVLKILKGKVAGGNIKGNAKLNGADKSLSVNAEALKVSLIELMKTLGVSSDSFNFISGSATDLYVDLSGKGTTYAAVAESLNGSVVAIVNKSELHLGNIGMMKGNIISQLFNTLNITKGNDDLNLRCAVVRTDVKDGKAEFPDGIVLNADKFTIVANGDINLKNDKISFSVKPFAGKLTDTNIAKALSSLVKLTGTLQEPKIGVDSANAIKTIVGVTTAGPAYLGAQMLLENDGSPCYTALANTPYADRFPKPANVVTDTAGDVGKILDDSVGMVKNTTKGLFNLLTGDANKKAAAQ